MHLFWSPILLGAGAVVASLYEAQGLSIQVRLSFSE